jgi:hypothetical protein
VPWRLFVKNPINVVILSPTDYPLSQRFALVIVELERRDCGHSQENNGCGEPEITWRITPNKYDQNGDDGPQNASE